MGSRDFLANKQMNWQFRGSMQGETLLIHRGSKEELYSHISSLKDAHTLIEKERYLSSVPVVKEFFLKPFIENLELELRYLLKSLIVAGQGDLLPSTLEMDSSLDDFCKKLRTIEEFYADVGGILGYQALVLELLEAKEEKLICEPPEAIDISSCSDFVDAGLAHLHEMGEIYPVGGAAERLQLREEGSGKELPAAKFQFLSSNLLEGLIRDLEAREYLYYKKYGKQIVTPVALMTSNVKQGHKQIVQLLEASDWFGRGRENFKLFCQPLVPAFDKNGLWAVEAPLKLALKPGGHGVLWKLAEREGVFDWFASLGRTKALVRQINNPVSGSDSGLLGFAGVGFLSRKKFGFASCPPALHAKEGRNVVLTDPKTGSKVLTNVEYCAFAKHGIAETSSFPANANILFVDLPYVRQVVKRYPYPGMIVNFKNGLARLETTMQNIADQIDVQDSYLTLNHRRKTLSATKREYKAGEALLETPLGTLLDYLKNGEELLREFCGVDVPEIGDASQFAQLGPSFFFHYHPALGPLYRDIAKKIRGGSLTQGSELQLEIADCLLENLSLDGRLVIRTKAVTGHFEHGRHQFSGRTGKCELRNVAVRNTEKESLSITLGENSKFIAENVTLSGNLAVEVPNDCIIQALHEGGELVLKRI